MSRRALIRKRCTSCSATIPDKACPKGHRRSTWSFTVDVNPPGGARRQITRSGFRTKAEAQQVLDEVQVSVSRQTYVERSKMTLGEYMKTWLAGLVTEGLAPTTIASYKTNVDAHIVARLGSMPLDALTPALIKEFYSRTVDARPQGRFRWSVGTHGQLRRDHPR
jgi:hypothetical protein